MTQPAQAADDAQPWRSQAACLHLGNLPWFDPALETQAKAVCAGCDVRLPCLAYAMDCGPDLRGVWGAKNPAEREAIRRNRESYEHRRNGTTTTTTTAETETASPRPISAACPR